MLAIVSYMETEKKGTEMMLCLVVVSSIALLL